MKNPKSFLPCLIFAALLLLCACYAHAQVSVALAPNPFLRFFDSAGEPLAGGFLYTYAAGTTTLQNTYVDSLGVIQNADPIPLDATGAPSNGTVQTMVWLANLSYKFCLYNSAMVPQGCKDNVTGYLGLLNQANTWNFAQTFTQPITDTQTDNQIIFGAGGNQTTLDFPPPSGNVTIHMPNVSDTMVGRQTTDTLTNKTLTNPLFNSSGCGIVNGPGTYICVANANPTGTTTGTLTKFINAPSQATIAAITDIGGVQGITAAGSGNTGTATIQQSGQVSCVFDGSTTAGDYVGISSTVAGNCHDTGSAYPVASQPIGRVLSTNGAPGSYVIDLFPPELIPLGAHTVLTTGVSTTVNANTTALQTIKTYTFPALALNTVGKSFRAYGQMDVTVGGGSSNQSLDYSFGVSAGLSGSQTAFVTTSASTTTIHTTFSVTCTVTATGVSGGLICSPIVSTNTGTASLIAPAVTPLDLTSPLFFGFQCSFSVASASNQCTQNQFVVEQLN